MLGRQSLLILLNNVAGGVLGVVTLSVVGHRMGPGPLGQFAYAWSLVSLVGILGDLGTGQAHVKRFSESGTDVRRSLGAFITVRAGLAGVVLVLIGVLLLTASAAPGLFAWGDRPPLALLVPLAAALLLTIARGIPLATWGARRETSRQELVLFVEHVTRCAATLLAVGLYATWAARAAAAAETRPRLELGGAVLLAWAALLAIGASAAVAGWMHVRSGIVPARPTRADVASYLRYAVPLALAGGAGLLAAHVDRITVGSFWGTDQVGLYQGAYRLHAFFMVVPAAAFVLLVPRLSELLSAGARGAATTLVAETTRRLSMVLLLAVTLGAVFAGEGTRLVLGAGFMASVPAFRLLLPFVLMIGVSVAHSAYLAGADRPGLLARATIAGALSNVALNLLLVPRELAGVRLAGLGIEGAALATSLSGVVTMGMTWRSTRSLGAPAADRMSLARQGLAAIGTAGLLLAWTKSPSAPLVGPIGSLAFGAIAGIACYTGLLVALREARASDGRFFAELVNPRAMVRYVGSELSAGRALANPPSADAGGTPRPGVAAALAVPDPGGDPGHGTP
jgi:O-antigen/teichoic acid export membrane protein